MNLLYLIPLTLLLCIGKFLFSRTINFTIETNRLFAGSFVQTW